MKYYYAVLVTALLVVLLALIAKMDETNDIILKMQIRQRDSMHGILTGWPEMQKTFKTNVRYMQIKGDYADSIAIEMQMFLDSRKRKRGQY